MRRTTRSRAPSGRVRVAPRTVGIAAGVLVVGLIAGVGLSRVGGSQSGDSGVAVGPASAPATSADDRRGASAATSETGFGRDRDGAAAAATNIVVTLSDAALVTEEEAIARVEALAAETTAQTLSAEMAEVWQSINIALGDNAASAEPDVFVLAVPLGHQVVHYSDDRASVQVWTLSLLAAEGMARPLASTETATVELVWEADGWRVWSLQATPGPSVVWSSNAGVTTVPQFLDEVADLEGYRHVVG